MRASVVMATVGEHDLSPILASYLKPGLSDAEMVLIIDNPAKDPADLTGAYCGDPRLRVIRNAANLGLTRSLIQGVDAAAGDIIIRNDDDDTPTTDRVPLILDYFARNPETDLVYTFAKGVDQASGSEWLIAGPATDAEIKRKLQERNFIVHSSIAFRRDSIRRIGNYSPHMRYAQDYELYLRAVRAGLKFGCIETVTMHRTYHSGSATVSRRKRQILYSFSAKLLHHAETGYDGST